MKFPIFIGLRYTAAPRNNQLLSFFTGVSITGLVVGVALLMVVLSIMNGFDRDLRQKILALVPQAAVYHKTGITDWPQLQTTLEKMPHIQAAAPFIQLEGLVSYLGKSQPVMLYGIEPKEEIRVSRITEFLGADTLKKLADQADQIILGKGLAQKLNIEEGEQLMLIVPDSTGVLAPRIQYFTLLKILETKTELDNALAITHLTSAAEILNNAQLVSGMRLKLDDLFAAREAVWSAMSTLGRDYYGSSWLNTHGNLYQAIQMSKTLVALLMSLIVAIATFNVVSTLVMVVVEKQGDIAILRTFGASTGEIMAIFMVQGSLIGFIGTLLGLIIGLGLTFLVQPLLDALESIFHTQFLKSDVYPLTYLPIDISLHDIIQVGITAFIMSILATLYPAWRASKTIPADILRYE